MFLLGSVYVIPSFEILDVKKSIFGVFVKIYQTLVIALFYKATASQER